MTILAAAAARLGTFSTGLVSAKKSHQSNWLIKTILIWLKCLLFVAAINFWYTIMPSLIPFSVNDSGLLRIVYYSMSSVFFVVSLSVTYILKAFISSCIDVLKCDREEVRVEKKQAQDSRDEMVNFVEEDNSSHKYASLNGGKVCLIKCSLRQ